MPADTPSLSYCLQELKKERIFCREAGSPESPSLLPLRGFPSSSFHLRDFIPLLAVDYPMIAPDYRGLGHSHAAEVGSLN